MKQLEKFFPIILFAVLAFSIVAPLLTPGYVLTLDQVSAGKIAFPSWNTPAFLFGSSVSFFNLFLPSYVLQKIILFLIFFLAGFSLFQFLPEKLGLARYFGGIFYAINPFFYERVMAGHWNLLLGYAVLPFIISRILQFLENPSKKKAFILAVFVAILFSVAVHFILIFLAFFIILTVIFIIFNQNRRTEILKYSTVFLIFLFLLNINWLLPAFFGKGNIASAIGKFSTGDLIVFQSVPDKNFGLIFNLASGYGFWPEVYDYFISPKSIIIFWPLISVTIMLLSLYGLVRLMKEKEKNLVLFTIALAVIFLLSLDFAGGIALHSFANTAFALYDKVPFLRGFREPQKLIGILMLCYAFFGSLGIYYLREKIARKANLIIIGIFIILPFIYTPTIFGSFWGQLRPVWYPPSWGKVNMILKEDKDNFLTLFFPWHQYMRFKFTNNLVVANPAPYFFDKPILSAKNYETKYLDTHDTRMEALHVEGLLSIEKNKVNMLGDPVNKKILWGIDLAPINVKYIILAKENDQKLYLFLDQSQDLEKIFEDDNLILYKNNRWSLGNNEIIQPLENYTKEDLIGL